MGIGSDALSVSILIPTHNQAAYIAEAVTSAQAIQSAGQEFDLEILIGDDASTDETQSICEALAQTDPRIIYKRHSRNIGRTANYRFLLEYAQGDWVLMLDGDDVLTNPNYIENALKAAKNTPHCVLVFGQINQGKTQENSVTCNDFLTQKRSWNGATFCLQHPPFKDIGLFHLSALYQRNTALAAGAYLTDNLSSDFESFYKLITHTSENTLAFIPEVAGFWRQHESNASQHSHQKAQLENMEMFARLERHLLTHTSLSKQDVKSALARGLAQYTLSIIKTDLTVRRKPLDAAKAFLKASTLNPRWLLNVASHLTPKHR